MVIDDVRLFRWIIVEIEELELRHLGVGKLRLDNHVASGLLVVAMQLPLPDAQAEGSAVAVVLLDEVVAAFGVVFAQQSTEHVEAVEAGVAREEVAR